MRIYIFYRLFLHNKLGASSYKSKVLFIQRILAHQNKKQFKVFRLCIRTITLTLNENGTFFFVKPFNYHHGVKHRFDKLSILWIVDERHSVFYLQKFFNLSLNEGRKSTFKNAICCSTRHGFTWSHSFVRKKTCFRWQAFYIKSGII